MWQIFGMEICCYCSFFSKRFGWICGLVLLYVKLPWNFPLRFKSLRDLCCLQPWQHSVYQLCWCVWDHLRTLLLVVIMAKVSNYSIKKKIKILHNKASTQLKYWRHWNAKGYWWAFPVLQASLESCVSLSLVLWQIYLDQEDLKSCLWKWTVHVGTVQNKYWQKMPEFTQK